MGNVSDEGDADATKDEGTGATAQDAGHNQPQEKARGRKHKHERKLTMAQYLDQDASGAALAWQCTSSQCGVDAAV